jgi:predicted RNA-binding Zn-ribbon protein involved in translation (DUF1610 family)
MEYQKGPCNSCGNNLEFPATLAGTTMLCPHCGQSTVLAAAEAKTAKRPKRTGTLIVGGVVLLAVAGAMVELYFAWHIGTPPSVAPSRVIITNASTAKTNPPLATVTAPPPDETPGKPRPKAIADLKVGEVKLEKTPGNSLVYAVGTVRNDSGWQRFNVKVELDLINLKGRIVGKTQDQKGILEPHQAWQFRALIPIPDVVAVKLALVTEGD